MIGSGTVERVLPRIDARMCIVPPSFFALRGIDPDAIGVVAHPPAVKECLPPARAVVHHLDGQPEREVHRPQRVVRRADERDEVRQRRRPLGGSAKVFETMKFRQRVGPGLRSAAPPPLEPPDPDIASGEFRAAEIDAVDGLKRQDNPSCGSTESNGTAARANCRPRRNRSCKYNRFKTRRIASAIGQEGLRYPCVPCLFSFPGRRSPTLKIGQWSQDAFRPVAEHAALANRAGGRVVLRDKPFPTAPTTDTINRDRRPTGSGRAR